MRKVVWIGLIGMLVLCAFGCASLSGKQKGAIIGGTTGAVIGGVVGDRAGNTAAGAIVGAAVGGATGAIIGNYMDKQAEEMEQELEGAQIERVGEGIQVTFGSGVLFDVNKYNLKPEAQSNLVEMAKILNKYEDTNILIEGHTDSDGSEEHNQTLSERRANAVSAFLAKQGVTSSRFTVIGYGETQPVADNSTAEGKQQNRRVEVAIMANEELKKRAETEAAQG